MSRLPFVIGQWVSGDTFYGRRRELAAMVDGSGFSWWAGLRRVGKTSLLREAERTAPPHRLPLFWDLQGVEDDEEAAHTFADALLDGQENFERRDLALPPLLESEGTALGPRLTALREALGRRGLGLLLLIDEGESLARLPATAEALAQALAPQDRLVVMTSPAASQAGFTPRYGPVPTTPTHWLGALDDEAAGALWRQDQSASAARPNFPPESAAEAIDRTGGHPMLLQMLGRRTHQLGNLEAAFRQLASERTLDHLLAVDFDLLTPDERRILTARAAGTELPDPPSRLIALGLIAPAAGSWRLGNAFLEDWLRRRAHA